MCSTPWWLCAENARGELTADFMLCLGKAEAECPSLSTSSLHRGTTQWAINFSRKFTFHASGQGVCLHAWLFREGRGGAIGAGHPHLIHMLLLFAWQVDVWTLGMCKDLKHFGNAGLSPCFLSLVTKSLNCEGCTLGYYVYMRQIFACWLLQTFATVQI